MRKLLIFGNGLGMSISPLAFDLRLVMTKVWRGQFLSDEQRELMMACLPAGLTEPSSEDQLATLQEIVAACETLLKIRSEGPQHWLTEQGQDFPNAVQRFAFEVSRAMYVAKHPHGLNEGESCGLPGHFAGPLNEFVRTSQSHVATLNYDGLLVRSFRQAELFNGAPPILRDGFVDDTFARTNLFREGEFGGWYMHLHGCPLFRDKGVETFGKLSEASLRRDTSRLKGVGTHVVLTHAMQKPSVISASRLLETYWEFLRLAIDEASEVVLLGYSGNDNHLNRLIAQRAADKPIRVVEWLGAGAATLREPFWKTQLGGNNVTLVQKEDVLLFTDWT
ncbi:hypothetical protein [Erythrobacter sp. QSSC1-22B]|uniref:hypothetical protein n=1 Tax=Erythrobacter sp. QSSC1-22B TaxID=1860125 RepID=UPI000ABCF0D1|nr:hypothetical protein [Erythrobacter sp. QSSC1-22B]